MPLNQPITESIVKSLPARFILCGEDDKDDEDLLLEIFTSVDDSYTLYFVNNGRRLVSALDQLPDDKLPCLLILDYNMPELNGAEILKELKKNKRYQSIPKIIWSTSDAPVYKKMCLELGASDYLVKPSKINALQDMIKHMLSYCS